MGQGIDLVRLDAPEHTAALDNFKDQLLLVLLRRLGALEAPVVIPIAEADDTGGLLGAFKIEAGAFHFELRRKT